MSDVLARPQFTKELVEQVFSEVGSVDSSVNVFSAEPRDVQNNSGVIHLYRLHLLAANDELDVISAIDGRDREKDAGKKCDSGLLVAHRVVRYAAESSGIPLPNVSYEYATGYNKRVEQDEDQLDSDFRQDYGYAPEVIRLVDDRLKNTYSKLGAKLLFEMYGKWANPARPDFKLPVLRQKDYELLAPLQPNAGAASQTRAGSKLASSSKR